MTEFEIEFIKLKSGHHEFNFQLENSFFEAFENADVLESKLSARIELERFPNWMNVAIHIQGEAGLSCDRCLEQVNIPVQTEFRMIYKHAEEMLNVDDDDTSLVILKPNDISINVAHPIYETIMLALPMIRNCDELEIKPCNAQMLNKLNQLNQNEDETQTEQTDPRWDKLKDLLK